MLSRRTFIGCAAASFTALGASRADIPRVDYHCHLQDGVDLERALAISKERGVKFGIVEHAGTKENKYPKLISDDEGMKQYIAMLEGKPVFKGIQAECLDWMSCFSKDVIAQLDYVLTDALTIHEKDGTRVELWRPWVKVDDKQEFMERYVAHHEAVMARPIDILANPTFLPKCIAAEHEQLWTPDRMKRVIGAAVANHVAIEINSGFKLPRLPFLKLAKQAGARFSFGSNIHGPGLGNIDYGLEMAKELGLKPKHIFTPAPAGKKPVQVRKFA